MAAKSLPEGICHFTIPMADEEKAILARLAYNVADMPLASFVRKLYLSALAQGYPKAAAEIAEARRRRRSATLAAIVIIGWISVLSGGDDSQLRQPPRTVRNTRSIRRWEEAV